MTRLLALSAALAALAAGPAAAQGFNPTRYEQTTLVSVAASAALPTASLRRWVDEPSLRGVQAEVRYPLASRWSVGLAGSFELLARNLDAATLPVGDATVTAQVYRRVQFGTLRATVHRHFGAGRLQPYLGVGAGGAWHGTRLGIGDRLALSDGFSLAVDPQAGFFLVVGRGVALHVNGRWQLTTAHFADVTRARWFAVGAGIAVY